MSQKVPVQEPGNVTEPEFRYIVLAFVGIGIVGGSTAAASLGIATLVGILAGGIAAYRVGKWVGARSRRRGFLIALSAIILAVFINVVATLTFLSQDPDLRSFMETSLGQPLRLNLTLLLQSLPPVVILIACAGAGVWRGSRKRSTMYL